MNESNIPTTNPNNSVTPDPIIPETVGYDQADQKEKSSAKQSEHLNTGLEPDTDWIVKCLIIWLIPIFGGLIFYNDPNPMLKLNARRSLVVVGIMILVVLVNFFFINYVAWLILSIIAILNMKDKKDFSVPGLDDIVKNIWKE